MKPFLLSASILLLLSCQTTAPVARVTAVDDSTIIRLAEAGSYKEAYRALNRLSSRDLLVVQFTEFASESMFCERHRVVHPDGGFRHYTCFPHRDRGYKIIKGSRANDMCDSMERQVREVRREGTRMTIHLSKSTKHVGCVEARYLDRNWQVGSPTRYHCHTRLSDWGDGNVFPQEIALQILERRGPFYLTGDLGRWE